MDSIDELIVSELQRNARTPQHEIARRAGLSQPAIAERIRKLEERRVLRGYAAIVDAEKLGKRLTAFVGVVIEHPKYFDAFAKRIQEVVEVLECHRVAGEFTYLLKVKTASPQSLDDLLTDVLRTLPGVTRTFTTIALVSLKETTFIATAPRAEEEAT